jgi:Domain of unknown function (DUF4123)
MQSANHSNHLHQWMAQHGHAHCFMLLDPTIRPLESDSDLSISLDAAKACGIDIEKHPLHLPLEAEVCPWIIELGTDKASTSHAIELGLQEALDELEPARLRAGLGRRIGGWLITHAQPQIITAHLARTMVIHHAGQRLLLRLHDSAVLWTLFHILSNAQRASLMGAIRHWWLLDPAGHLVCLDNPAELTDSNRTPAQTVLLRLKPDQWADVLRLDSLNAALNQWLEEQAAPPSADVVAGARTVAMAAMRRAATCGLHTALDLKLFALHSMRTSPSFDSHPLVQALLPRCNTGKSKSPENFSAVIEELSPDDWARIRTESVA